MNRSRGNPNPQSKAKYGEARRCDQYQRIFYGDEKECDQSFSRERD